MLQDEALGDRVRVLKSLLGPSPPKVVVTNIHALVQPVPSRESLSQQTRMLQTGERISVEELSAWLVGAGFQNTTAVDLPGEFSLRGGIIDIFAPDWFDPVRIEFFGDEIESIRRFQVSTQRSLATLKSVDVNVAPRRGRRTEPDGNVATPSAPATSAHLADFLPPASWFLLIEARRPGGRGPSVSRTARTPRGLPHRGGRDAARGGIPVGNRIFGGSRLARNHLPIAN